MIDCYGRKHKGKLDYIGQASSTDEARRKIAEYVGKVPYALEWKDNRLVALGAYPFGFYEAAREDFVDEW